MGLGPRCPPSWSDFGRDPGVWRPGQNSAEIMVSGKAGALVSGRTTVSVRSLSQPDSLSLVGIIVPEAARPEALVSGRAGSLVSGTTSVSVRSLSQPDGLSLVETIVPAAARPEILVSGGAGALVSGRTTVPVRSLSQPDSLSPVGITIPGAARPEILVSGWAGRHLQPQFQFHSYSFVLELPFSCSFWCRSLRCYYSFFPFFLRKFLAGIAFKESHSHSFVLEFSFSCSFWCRSLRCQYLSFYLHRLFVFSSQHLRGFAFSICCQLLALFYPHILSLSFYLHSFLVGIAFRDSPFSFVLEFSSSYPCCHRSPRCQHEALETSEHILTTCPNFSGQRLDVCGTRASLGSSSSASPSVSSGCSIHHLQGSISYHLSSVSVGLLFNSLVGSGSGGGPGSGPGGSLASSPVIQASSPTQFSVQFNDQLLLSQLASPSGSPQLT